MNLSRLFSEREYAIYGLAALTSLLLSWWIAYNQSIVNPDAICYLMSAENVGKQGIHGAMTLCGQAKWPFYSLLIYAFVQMSHLSYPLAAYIADGFFSLMSVLMFILIVKELGGNVRVLGFAAFTILLSHEFNSIREYIIRDHGFWAFYLSSLWLLLYFFRKPTWSTGLLWNASIFIAALFRIEGVIFLVLLPFLAFFYVHYTWPQRFKLFCRLNALTLLVLLGACVWLASGASADHLGRLQDLINQLQHGITLIALTYQDTKMKLATQILSHDSMMNAGEVFFILMIGWYLISVATNLSWIYSLLAFYAWRRRLVYFPFSARLVLTAYILINVLITACFLLENLFLSKRYLIGLSLVLMIWAPFALNYLYERSYKWRYQLSLAICLFLAAVSALGGIFDFGYSKAYIRQAGVWMTEHVPKNAALYANDYQLMYYSRHFGNDIFTKLPLYMKDDLSVAEKWQQFDYLALRINKKDPNQYAHIFHSKKCEPVVTFQNKRGDKVSIFKVKRAWQDFSA